MISLFGLIRKKPDGTDVGVEDARFMVGHLAVLTNNADTKAGLIAAATTVLMGFLIGQRELLNRHVQEGGALNWTALGAFTIAILSGAVATFSVARSLWPRTNAPRFSRYSWPVVATVQATALTRSDSRGERAEAWTTAQDMSRILNRKYRYLRFAISAWLVAASFLMLWFLLTPWPVS